jgi:hypothetical protein
MLPCEIMLSIPTMHTTKDVKLVLSISKDVEYLRFNSSSLNCAFIFRGAAAPSGSGPLHYQDLTIALTRYWVGLLETSDQPDAETSA